ncbi:MAG: hypothetical protein ABDH32_07505 [Candidatus Caldarchaeales archaeon]
MIKKTLIIFTLLLLIFITYLPSSLVSSVSAAPAGIEILDHYWGQGGEEWAAIPGDRNVKLTLTIQNREDTTICGLKAIIYDDKSGRPFPFRSKDEGLYISSYYDAHIRIGEAKNIEFDVTIIPEASPGYYEVPIYFEYLDCEDPDYPILSTLSKITLKVWDYPEIKVLDSRWVDQDGSPTYAGPGSYAKFLTLTFYVPRYYSASNIKAVLHLSNHFTNLTGGDIVEEFYSERAVGGQSFTINFGLNIKENTPIGFHTLKLDLKYYNRWLSEVEQEIEVPVKVSGLGDLDIQFQGILISTGSSRNAEIILKNSGTAPIYSISSRAISEGGLIILSEITKEVDILMPGESIIFKPLIFAPPTLPEGSYMFTLSVSYIESSGLKKTDTRGVGVYVRSSPEIGMSAYVEGEPLIASRTSKVKIVLKNLYDAPVTEVKTLLSLRGLPIVIVGGEQSAYFSKIESGEKIEIPVELLVSPKADETVYEGSLTVSYRDPLGQPRTDTLSISFIVRGLIKLTFRQLQVGSSTIYPGSTVDILGEILNSGTVTARMTEVRLVLEEPLTESPYSTYYIGDISPYSTSSFTLSFSISKDAKPGIYKLKIIGECENTYGEKIETSDTFEVKVDDRPPETSPSPTQTQSSISMISQNILLILILTVVLIVGILYGFVRRTRKKLETT